MSPRTERSKSALAAILPQIDTLTFDCYGTLIDWRAGLKDSFLSTFGPACQDRLPELFEAYVETEGRIEAGPYQPYRQIVSQVVERLSVQFGLALPPGGAAAMPQSLPGWRPFTDTNDALLRLKRKFRLGVLSNIDQDLFVATARHFSIEFDFVVTAQDVESYKPAAGHFNQLAGRYGSLDQVLHVAQSQYHDGRACLRHGLAFVWINRYNDRADPAVRTLAEFADLESFADAVCG